MRSGKEIFVNNYLIILSVSNLSLNTSISFWLVENSNKLLFSNCF